MPSPDSETIGNSALPKRGGLFLPDPSAGGLRVGARGGHLPGETLRPSRSAADWGDHRSLKDAGKAAGFEAFPLEHACPFLLPIL